MCTETCTQNRYRSNDVDISKHFEAPLQRQYRKRFIISECRSKKKNIDCGSKLHCGPYASSNFGWLLQTKPFLNSEVSVSYKYTKLEFTELSVYGTHFSSKLRCTQFWPKPLKIEKWRVGNKLKANTEKAISHGNFHPPVWWYCTPGAMGVECSDGNLAVSPL